MRSMIWNGRLILISLLFVYSCQSSKINEPLIASYDVIPIFQELDTLSGFFILNDAAIYTSDTTLSEELNDILLFSDHYKINIKSVTSPGIESQITIKLSDENFGNEGYDLFVSKEQIVLTSNTKEGVYRGLTSLKQLALLNYFEGHYFIPLGNFEDHALFEHRGLLLDCSRHFFSKEVVKKYIDLLSFYKMNVLHWHLTEDQAWRIAIDNYPRLSEFAAWRTEPDGSIYGGFYSKEDIKEIVAYASEKYITVIPEIELPGHSQAAIAAYPYLSCTGDSIAVENDWGVFKEIYCAGNDSVFAFLEDVLTEVMELFPSKYIHIGGDEAPKTRWEQCPKCQQRMKEEKLENEHELQSYFIQRIQTFLNKNDRQIIGWDEILEGGLAEAAVVQSWRGMDGGMDAVKHGNKAIMSPTSHAYLDYDLKAIDLEKVYSFYPIPEGLTSAEARLIIGGECNIWTEHVPDEATLDSKVFPRLLAMSEVLWSDSSGRDYDEFIERVYLHYSLLDSMKVNYGLESIPFKFETSLSDSGIEVSIIPKLKNIEIDYTLNDALEKAYDSPLLFSAFESSIIKGIAKRKDKAIGDTAEISLYPHLALNKSVNYISDDYSSSYTGGGEKALVDGVLGSLDFRDGHWQGYFGKDVECIIDLGSQREDVNEIETHFYQYVNSWIFIPKELIVQISNDGITWSDWAIVESEVNPKTRGKFISTFKAFGERQAMRYLKIKVKNFGKTPYWHEAAGADTWIFIDEIVVK